MFDVSGGGNAGGVRYLGSDLLCPLEADCDFKNSSLASDIITRTLRVYNRVFISLDSQFYLNAKEPMIVSSHNSTYNNQIVTNLVQRKNFAIKSNTFASSCKSFLRLGRNIVLGKGIIPSILYPQGINPYAITKSSKGGKKGSNATTDVGSSHLFPQTFHFLVALCL